MSETSKINSTFLKGAIAAGVAVAIDMTFLKDPSFKSSAMVGVSAGLGAVAGNYLAQMTPALLPDDSSNPPLYTGKAVMDRVFEVGGSTAGIYLLQKYVDIGRQDSIVEIVGVSAVSVFVAEVIDDYISSRPISVFA